MAARGFVSVTAVRCGTLARWLARGMVRHGTTGGGQPPPDPHRWTVGDDGHRERYGRTKTKTPAGLACVGETGGVFVVERGRGALGWGSTTSENDRDRHDRRHGRR